MVRAALTRSTGEITTVASEREVFKRQTGPETGTQTEAETEMLDNEWLATIVADTLTAAKYQEGNSVSRGYYARAGSQRGALQEV